VGDRSRGRFATPADFPLHVGTSYDVGVWDLSIIHRPFSVAPCQTLSITIRNFFCIAVRQAEAQRHEHKDMVERIVHVPHGDRWATNSRDGTIKL
jgi:hypothetical protein